MAQDLSSRSDGRMNSAEGVDSILTPTDTTLVISSKALKRQSEVSMLRELGYQDLMVADTGTEAWYIIKNFAVTLILCDWELDHDMSGLLLLRILRADPAYTDIPFFLVVDKVTRRQVIEAGQSGVTDILLRPLTPDVLKQKLSQAKETEGAPDSLTAQRLLEEGQSLLRQGRHDEALSTFRQVLITFESAEVHYNIGYIMTAQSRFEEAIMAFRKATLINQTFALAYHKLGDAYAKLGQNDNARACLERAAQIYMEKNLDAEAEQTFMRVLEINPNTPNVFNSLGIVYRRQRKFEESVNMYMRALRVDPEDERIYYNLARSYIEMGKPNDAADALRKALSIKPDFIEANNLLQTLPSVAKST
jgi:tetratricopeptide (TPR) repeat protein